MSSLHLRTHRYAQAEESARSRSMPQRPQKSSMAIGYLALSRALDAASKTEEALTVVREGIALPTHSMVPAAQ